MPFTHYTDPDFTPDPLQCENCLDTALWYWDGEEWVSESEWWYYPGYDFLCSRWCYLRVKEHNESLYDN